MKAVNKALAALDSSSHWTARAVKRQAWRDAGIHTGETMPRMLERCVAAHPDIEIVFGSLERPSVTSTRAVMEESATIARALSALGLVEGDVIALQIPNWRESLLALIAAWRLGLVVVPMVHVYGAAEISFILRTACAKALIVPDRWKNIDYGRRIADMDRSPDLAHVIVIGDEAMPGAVTRWSDLAHLAARVTELPGLRGDADDACLINFTSGTTSAPKGVVHTHHSIGSEIVRFPDIASSSGRPKLLPLPGGHIAGLTHQLQPFLTQRRMILMDQFDEALCLALIRRYRPEASGGVPFQVNFYCDHPAETFPDGCVQMTVGATSVSPALMQRCEALGWPATRIYGSTEHPTISGSLPADPFEKRAFTDGRLLEGVEVRIVDDDGAPVGVGLPGEIISIGPDLFKGYLDPALNDDAFTSDGWFRTGDMGVLDEQGFLTIVDRKKDIIIRGGENISSKEVEDVLMLHPDVAEVAAVASAHPRLGERVCVFVRLKPGGALDLDMIRTHFRSAGVAVYKTPEEMVLLDAMPRNPTGKILKNELRQRLRDANTQGLAVHNIEARA